MFKILIIVSILFTFNIYAQDNRQSVGMIIPLYSHPDDVQDGIGVIWDAVADAGKKIPITVVIGINDENTTLYTDAIQKLHQSSVRVLGYVATGLATSQENPPQPRNKDDVKSEIEYFATNFDVDGIFLDEGLAFDELSNGEELFNYYQDIDLYAKSFSQIKDVMLNVSYIIADDINRSSIDDFLVFENVLIDPNDGTSNWDTFVPSQYEGLDFSKLHIIVHGIDDIDTMMDIFNDSVYNKNIKNLYFTDREFLQLPSYWYKEVDAIKAYNNALTSKTLPTLYYLLF